MDGRADFLVRHAGNHLLDFADAGLFRIDVVGDDPPAPHDVIECPKHNGRFNYRTGEAKGAPACVNLATYPVEVVDGKVMIAID